MIYRIFLSLAAALAAAPEPAPPAAPYPPSPVLSGVRFDFTTHVRRAIDSDNWAVTWAADGNQYATWGDGRGFDGGRTKKSLGYSRIEGNADDWTARDTYGSEKAEATATLQGKSYAILGVNGALYSFVSPGSDAKNLESARLYKSNDGAHRWTPTPVVFTAAKHHLALPCFLQFGKDDAGARDGYVYVYWLRVRAMSWEVQRPGEIMLTRVPRGAIEDSSRYEYFAGLDGAGEPRWSTDPGAMRAAFADPNGLMRSSANYDAGLGRYLVVTNHTARNAGNVGIFDAPEPWGPWTTVAYYRGWPGGAEVPRNTFYGNFSSKWFSDDGLDFVFVFTGKNANDSWNSVRGSFVRRSPRTDPARR